jgi:hypothetical protein
VYVAVDRDLLGSADKALPVRDVAAMSVARILMSPA